MNERIDSHKLMFHPERVSAWNNGKQIYPIYVEMSLTNNCNLRCKFCALDFMRTGKNFLDLEKTKHAIDKMAELGIKSIMLGGEGEPLLYPEIIELVEYIHNKGIDIAITTNGTYLEKDIAEHLIAYCKWVKISVNAGTVEDYRQVHGLKSEPSSYYLYERRLWGNIAKAMFLKHQKESYGCNTSKIGIQAIVLKENIKNLDKLIKAAIFYDVNYVVLKPYSLHSSSINQLEVYYSENDRKMLQEYEKMSTIDMPVIIRHNAFDRVSEQRTYDICHAMPFWSYIDSNGNVWSCSAKMPDERFILGNIYKDDLRKVWEKPEPYKIENCRTNCRMEECNKYLHELKNPDSSVNFI